MATSDYHEPYDLLAPSARDMHRAVQSLVEELQAIDWYAQRVEVVGDGELKEILAHNGDEEKEHASMLLEWIRRQDPAFGIQLERHLFHAGPIVPAAEGSTPAGTAAPSGPRPSVGSLKEGKPT